MELIIVGTSLLILSHIYMRIKRNYYRRNLSDISAIYDIMGEVVAETNIDRFLILYTTNGGGVPHIGGHLYGSVLYEYRTENLPRIKSKFQKVPADQGYIDLLLKVERAGEHGVMIKTEELEGSLLESIYRRDGITTSYVFKIKDTKYKYYYASVQTTDTTGVLDLATIQMGAARIRNLFKNAK